MEKRRPGIFRIEYHGIFQRITHYIIRNNKKGVVTPDCSGSGNSSKGISLSPANPGGII